ncbi:MAG TPA: Zn-ribbon domain-containing OB-fold protein [Quisquiliibacterium sp.]|nr:MAG: Zn-ribbon domain-containing OB-fold protein [Burkholderiaceae bacterium]HOA92653.1 Zn-ribbon domain-containing OB-fold protein [Quisquiliibacterium sp.]HPA88155.1 Zn-ribbon domain-containing OB-fold protein [Quisquiliibacterium sp.]HQD81780.1 Zn-ribbon domain-containing OB-fold protein [Quisquiliibacterium sp.]HQN10995.1 Zn-ribbon domain-containing OB-fold protein [Quisquiliibacterium sp.]
MSTVRKMPAPLPNPENQPYWDAAKEGKLLVKRCKDCGEFHFYPRAICPFCFSDQTEWVESKGTGSIYSYSVMRRGVPVPFAIAYVTLDEGITMLTNMADGTDLDGLSIGQKVKVAFKAAEDGSAVPVFTPA